MTEVEIILELNQRLQKARVIPPTKCVDGFEASIQASCGHYCSPRDDVGPWGSFEVAWFEGEDDPLVIEWHGAKASDGVYGWVPAKVVAAMIIKHGGFINTLEALPPPCPADEAW